MLSHSRKADTGVKLEVNEKILDSCTGLMHAIRILVQKSRILQAEIVAQGKVIQSNAPRKRSVFEVFPAFSASVPRRFITLIFLRRELRRRKNSTRETTSGPKG